jgi:hypothetical protein
MIMTVIVPSAAVTPRGCSSRTARALSRADVEHLLTARTSACASGSFGWMLYETAARSAEILAPNVEDLDLRP